MARPLRLEWRGQAVLDLMEIVSYIAQDNPDAAQALKNDIETCVGALPSHPKLYKASSRVHGMRELVVRKNYIVFYRETSTLIEVVSVVHARRLWPPARSPRHPT